MRPTWVPPGSCRPQMGPMWAPWILLSGVRCTFWVLFQIILFSFREFVLSEDNNDCQSAVLWYYDGEIAGRTLRFCGTELPNVTRSSTNVVIFKLRFSDQHSWSGFRIDYAAVHKASDSLYPVIGTGNNHKLLNTLWAKIFQRKHKHILIFYVISPHWRDSSSSGVRQGLTSFAQSISWLVMSWPRKKPGISNRNI